MKIKNVLLTGLSFVLVGAVAIGSTLAYLTSEDSDVNVMTLGNVSIEQVEYERDENGNLVEFSQAKPAFPAVYDTEAWAEEGVNVNGDEYKVFSNDMKNVIDKIVTVNNTGKSDAFVRTLIAIEAPEGDPNNLIHINFNSTDVTVTKSFLTDINNVTYYVMCCTYNEAIAANEKSAPSLMQVFLDKKATNEDCAKFGDAWEILVMSQAVQTEGFANAATALDTAFGAVDEAKVAEWFGDAEIPVIVNKDNIDDVLSNGSDAVLGGDLEKDANNSNAYGKTAISVQAGQTLDGANNSFEAAGANSTWDSAINITGGTIKNLTVSKGFRGIFINHNAPADKCGLVTLKNVVIDGPIYTISCDQGTGNNLEAYNCVLNGWTSYAATIGEVKFVNTSFGEGAGYAFCRPYAPTTFVGCDFEAGYELDARATVTFENCTIGGQPLTSANLSTLVTSNIQNASVK